MKLSSKQRSTATWIGSSIVTIVAGVIAVQSWAKDNFVTQEQAQQEQAVQQVIHDKQYLSRMLDHNETRLTIAKRQARSIRKISVKTDRDNEDLLAAEENVQYYTAQLLAIRNKLRIVE